MNKFPTHQEKINKYGDPIPGKIYVCEVVSFTSKKMVIEELLAVKEDDCSWRTADDNSELNVWNWDVVSWKLKDGQ